jgi:hypothetical protein
MTHDRLFPREVECMKQGIDFNMLSTAGREARQ